MIFVIGLGNPGTRFNATRHNIGFEVVERLAYDFNIKIDRNKHRSFVGQGVIKGEKVLLIKPQTYMNNSGEAVHSILDFYKETTDSIIVVYDDTDTDVGRLRIRERGSAGGHNGIKNIIAHLKTQEFDRVRVGVGAKPPGYDMADYVLSRFSDNEIPVIQKAVKMAADAVVKMIDEGTHTAMNVYNGMVIE